MKLIKASELPKEHSKSYFALDSKDRKIVAYLLDPSLYYDGKKRTWMVNQDYYNADVAYWYDDDDDKSKDVEQAAKEFAKQIQTKEGTVSRLNAIEWFKAGAKWEQGKEATPVDEKGAYNWTNELVLEFAKQYRFSSSRISIENFMRELEENPTPIKESIEEVTFEEYMRNAREKFLIDIHNQPWNNEMRTAAEDFLICFDQMREKLLAAASTDKGNEGERK